MDTNPIILFDGVCNLCNGVVQFVITHDPHEHFRFAALQSAVGQRLLAQHGLPLDGFDTIVLVDNATAYTNSEAPLRIAEHLSGLWPLLRFLRILPRPLRDWLYHQIVSHRYQWFGKRDTCMIPTPELRERFLN